MVPVMLLASTLDTAGYGGKFKRLIVPVMLLASIGLYTVSEVKNLYMLSFTLAHTRN